MFVSPSPDGLQLKAKKVFNEMGFDAGQAGVASGRASSKHEYEYEAPADSKRTVKYVIPGTKSGHAGEKKKIAVEDDLLYLTVVEYESKPEERFKFIQEAYPIRKLDTYNIKQEHLERSIPYKFTRKMPTFSNGVLVEEMPPPLASNASGEASGGASAAVRALDEAHAEVVQIN